MMDDELNEQMKRHLAEYHRPDEPPRDAMWQVIMRERTARRLAHRPASGARRIAAWGLAAAALVALGVGLDRMTDRGTPAPAPVIAATDTKAGPSTAQRLAAQDVFGQAEVFLTGYRADVSRGTPDRTSPAEARKLLGATRLLLDSRAATDPRLRLLLEDLELTLAQISQDGGNPSDARTITQSLDQRGMLMELRSNVKPGPAAAVSQGAI